MKLQHIISEDEIPVIKRIQWSPAAIYIMYPSGKVWEYVIYDDPVLKDLLRRYKYNVGNLIAALKRLKIEANPI